jgi:hypothetical protein
MDNPEKLATYIGYTRRRKTKRTHNTICIEYHYNILMSQKQLYISCMNYLFNVCDVFLYFHIYIYIYRIVMQFLSIKGPP